MTHPSGIMHRRVMLEGNWWKDCDGALLAVTKDKGEFCALLPRKTGGYSFWNTSSGAREKLTSKHKDMFEKEALCFYEPLPEEVKNGKQLLSIKAVNGFSFSRCNKGGNSCDTLLKI